MAWLLCRPSSVPFLQLVGYMNSDAQSATRWVSIDLEDLDLTVRAYNCLRNAGIASVRELIRKTPEDLLSIRAMGKTSVHAVQNALAAHGLHLGTPEIDHHACRSINEFLMAMDQVRGLGITDIAELVTQTPQEVAELQGVDSATVMHIRDGLAKWGLSLGMWSGRERSIERVSPGESTPDKAHGLDQQPTLSEAVGSPRSGGEASESSNQAHCVTDEWSGIQTSERWSQRLASTQTFREELTNALARQLEGPKSRHYLCFTAYHGIEGRTKLTLQDIADQGFKHGFATRVTRERVRQVVKSAERILRSKAIDTIFPSWVRAVLTARRLVPSPFDRIVETFGYDSCANPHEVFSMLSRVADIFSLQFPFGVQSIHGTEFVTDQESTKETTELVNRLKAIGRETYYDTEATAKTVGCDRAILEKAVGVWPGWEFLDDGHRYFWKLPQLPPHKYSVTGNAILTGLCKVFSVAQGAATVDLAQAVSRQRGVRKKLPREVIEGVASQSGLFELVEGVLRRKEGQTWFCLSERDMQLLRVYAEHGRVVSSHVLHSSLVRSGLTSENAGIVIAYSPFLLHTKAGMFRSEGLYKLVCSTDDIVSALRDREQLGIDQSTDLPPQTESTRGIARIAVSSRVRLSGSFVAPESFDMDGQWRVRAVDRAVIGRVTLSGRYAEGLCSVIEALGLEANSVLELRRHRDGELVAIRG